MIEPAVLLRLRRAPCACWNKRPHVKVKDDWTSCVIAAEMEPVRLMMPETARESDAVTSHYYTFLQAVWSKQTILHQKMALWARRHSEPSENVITCTMCMNGIYMCCLWNKGDKRSSYQRTYSGQGQTRKNKPFWSIVTKISTLLRAKVRTLLFASL